MNNPTTQDAASGGSDLLDQRQVLGTVVAMQAENLLLTLPGGVRGILARSEFGSRARSATPGSTLPVFVAAVKDDGAHVSERKAEALALWDTMAAAVGTDQMFEGEIVAEIKGGFVVDLGLRGFLPMSQADARPVEHPRALVGKRSCFHVVEFNAKRGTVVLSRRAMAEAERDVARVARVSELTVGDVLSGVVRRVVSYGAFVDVGQVEGLLHLKDIGWGRIDSPADVLHAGQKLRVKVLEVDRNGGKVKVGLRQTLPDPWETVATRYKEGQRVRGKVVSVASFGAFMELEPGIEGLIHVSAMSWTERVDDPAQLAPVGAELEVVILGVDMPGRRLSLGLRQTQPNPWKIFVKEHPEGSVVRGQVKIIEDDGVVVTVDGLDGFVHTADLAWSDQAVAPASLYKPGDELEAMVLGVEPRAHRFALGVKQLTEDPWTVFAQKHPRGSTVSVTVKELLPNGVMVEIEPGFEAFCHVSQLALDRIKSPGEAVKRGEVVEAQISELEPERRRIAVSVKALLQGEKNYRAYMTDQGNAASPLAQALGPIAAKLRDKKKS